MAYLSNDLNAVLDGLAGTEHAAASVESCRLSVAKNSEALDRLGSATPVGAQDRVRAVADAAEVLLDDVSRLPRDSAQHARLVEKNWSTLCWLPAGCIVSPRTVAEAALALRLITRFRASFSVRSNGHLAEPGFSSIGESGVLLDLGYVSQVELSASKEVVRVGPGATWDKVYEELERYELTAVGGRVKGVGVAGLILGGGLSHFPNAWGMACDSVRNFEVLLADSTVVQANANENTDLFWALKGGGPNFGIVTRFDLQTYPDYRIWCSVRTFADKDAARVMRAAAQVQEAMDDDENLGLIVVGVPGFVTTVVVYRGHLDAAPTASAALDEIAAVAAPPPENSTQAKLCAKMCTDMGMDAKIKRQLGTLSLQPDAEVYADFFDILCKLHAQQDFRLQFVLQPVGPAAVRQGQRHGGNCMNMGDLAQTWVFVCSEWTDQRHDEAAKAVNHALRGQLRDAAKQRGKDMEFMFMNDACASQNPLASYGADTLDRLWDVSRKYDWKGVFQELQNDGFLLSKASL